MSHSKQDADNNNESQKSDEILDELESLEHDQAKKEDESAPFEEQADGEDTIEALQQQLVEAQVKADENWDTALRIQAEMDNLRKRSTRQVEDAHKYAVQKFVEELLPVADSLEMGMAAEGDVEKIREGIGLTMNVLKSVMEKFSVIAIDPLGEKFNPDLHQAMAMQPSEEYENDHVSAVMQKGYTLNGRLVRPAMVMVAKN